MAEMVTIKCRSPQVNGRGESVCAGTRRILPQDVHQVTRCVPCQRQSAQNYRNAKAHARRMAARPAVRRILGPGEYMTCTSCGCQLRPKDAATTKGSAARCDLCVRTAAS